MFDHIRFYVKHSLNDLRVNGQRTLFALLCIAAGVAAIVSLQTLAIMIDNALTTSLQEANQGDLRIEAFISRFDVEDEAFIQAGEDGLVTPGTQVTSDYFSTEGLDRLQAWADENFPGQVTATARYELTGIAPGLVAQNGENVPFTLPFVIEAEQFPFYGTIATADGATLADLLQGPEDIALNATLAESLAVQVGDRVRIFGTEAAFTVRGIIDPDSSSSVSTDNLGAAIVGAYYIDVSALDRLPDPTRRATTVYWQLEDPTLTGEIDAALAERFPYLEAVSTDDLAQTNELIADGINQLVSVMGLLSLLIGGIGIINTMQVIVRRRTLEIAVLKTVGLQARQVTTLFLVEAALMGVIGSLFGVVAGWLLTLALEGVAEAFFGRSLNFVIAPGPALAGIVVGVLVATVFGLLPTLSAGQVRPGVVLRPNDALVPRAGFWRSAFAVAVVIVALSVIAAGFIGLLAAAVVPFAFVVIGLLYALLSMLIWVVGRFVPSFGVVDLKVALRAMLASRPRGASTLLALAAGVFTLSVLTLLTGTLLSEFQSVLVRDIGGNVIVFAPAGGDTSDRVNAVLEDTPGMVEYAASITYSVQLLQVEKAATGEVLSFEQLQAQVDESGFGFGFGDGPPGAGDTEGDGPGNATPGDVLDFLFGSLDARDVTANLPQAPFTGGRQLTPADAGEPVIVIGTTDFTPDAGIEVGDRITFAFAENRLRLFGVDDEGAPTVTFTVVGITDRTGSAPVSPALHYVPIEAIPAGVTPVSVSAIVEIEDEQIEALRDRLSTVPGVFVLETALLNDLVNALVEQFTAFPILVSGLTLLVGGVVIANSVALATMERRREIAVMKAIGMQRERVLGMLLLENSLLGLIGGFIGVGIGLMSLVFLVTNLFVGFSLASIPYGTALLLMFMCVGIAVIAAMLTAWGASGEKPLNVLRYE